MIIDALNLFSDAQAVTTTAVSTSSVDLGIAARDIGKGEDLFLVVQLAAAMTGTNANSTLVELVTDDNPGINSAALVQTIGTFPTNSLVGTRLIVPIAPGTFERYIALRYTPANTLTTCSITSFITGEAPDGFQAYAKSTGSVIATS